MKLNRGQVAKLNHYLYPWLSAAVLIFLLSEIVCSGFIRAYLNINIWLIFWVASVILKLILLEE